MDRLYDLAVELCAFGPGAERQMMTRTGVGIEGRLDAIRADLDMILGQLRNWRPEYIDNQLQRLGISNDSSGLKLHLGCGAIELSGWINVGAYPAQLSMASTWDLPFKDGSVNQVFVSRVPESLLLPIEIRKFLSEIYRVLAFNGALQILVGDLVHHPQEEPKSLAIAYRNWAEARSYRTRLDGILVYLGALASNSRGHLQRASFEISALIYLLVDEKFSEVTYKSTAGDSYVGSSTAATLPMSNIFGANAHSYVCARKLV